MYVACCTFARQPYSQPRRSLCLHVCIKAEKEKYFSFSTTCTQEMLHLSHGSCNQYAFKHLGITLLIHVISSELRSSATWPGRLGATDLSRKLMTRRLGQRQIEARHAARTRQRHPLDGAPFKPVMTGGSISYLLGRASIRDYYQSHSTPDSKTYRFTEGRAPLQLLEQVTVAAACKLIVFASFGRRRVASC